jgi:HK97 gp10 family phage protein
VSPITSNRLPQIAAAAKPTVETILSRSAFEIEAQAKVASPVGETGNLQNSINAARERELTWRVTAHADYAVYVELGTRRMTAQPYLDPALRQGQQFLNAALKAIL